MSKLKFVIGSAAGLLLVLGTLGACDQTYQSDNSGGARRTGGEGHAATARVARHAERAARDVSRSVTAVAKSVEKGVREGVRQGQRDYHSQQAANEPSQDQEARTSGADRRERSPSD